MSAPCLPKWCKHAHPPTHPHSQMHRPHSCMTVSCPAACRCAMLSATMALRLCLHPAPMSVLLPSHAWEGPPGQTPHPLAKGVSMPWHKPNSYQGADAAVLTSSLQNSVIRDFQLPPSRPMTCRAVLCCVVTVGCLLVHSRNHHDVD